MLEDDNDNYEVHLADFNECLDTNMHVEALVVEAENESEKSSIMEFEDPACKADTWATLPINLSDLGNKVERPSEDIYEPTPAWERPAGHAV
jgi:hypothetical protein